MINRDGSKGCGKFAEQIVGAMNCHGELYADLQPIMNIDRSSGHAKFRDDGLHVGYMDLKFRG